MPLYEYRCTVCDARFSRTESDRKSTRLNSSHSQISYAVFCLKKKKIKEKHILTQSMILHLLNAVTADERGVDQLIKRSSQRILQTLRLYHHHAQHVSILLPQV